MRNTGIASVRRVDEDKVLAAETARGEKRWRGWFGGATEKAAVGGEEVAEKEDGEGDRLVDAILRMARPLEDAKRTAERVRRGEVLERWVELRIPEVR